MLKSQKLQIEALEAKSRINEIRNKESLTDGETAELETLQKRDSAIPGEMRAAIAKETAEADEKRHEFEAGDGIGTPEERELREIRGRVRLGEYFSAAAEERGVEGVEAEYNQHRKLRPGYFPLDLLAPEMRAETNADGQANQQRWLDRLFAGAAAMRLGITFESVEPGQASYPVTTAGATGAQRGREETAADAVWTVGVTELKPTRNAVRAIFTVEDAMRLPGLEGALRRDLQMALSDAIDATVFKGDSGADEAVGDITGLQTAANVVEKTITQANKLKPAESLAAFVGLVDGKHAASVGDLRVVLAVGAHTLWATTIANSAAENQTILAFLKSNGLMCTVRGDLEDATAADDFGAFIGRGRGIEGAGVAAIWEAAQLIRDPYSSAAKGEVALTMHYLWAFGLPRASSFARVKFVA